MSASSAQTTIILTNSLPGTQTTERCTIFIHQLYFELSRMCKIFNKLCLIIILIFCSVQYSKSQFSFIKSCYDSEPFSINVEGRDFFYKSVNDNMFISCGDDGRTCDNVSLIISKHEDSFLSPLWYQHARLAVQDKRVKNHLMTLRKKAPEKILSSRYIKLGYTDGESIIPKNFLF